MEMRTTGLLLTNDFWCDHLLPSALAGLKLLVTLVMSSSSRLCIDNYYKYYNCHYIHAIHSKSDSCPDLCRHHCCAIINRVICRFATN